MASLEIAFVWETEAGDCSICDICGDMIFGQKHNLVMDCGKRDIAISICGSCRDEVDDKDDDDIKLSRNK